MRDSSQAVGCGLGLLPLQSRDSVWDQPVGWFEGASDLSVHYFP